MSRRATEWEGLFASSTITGPGNWGVPTNYPLLERMTDALRTQQPRPALVVFGEDILWPVYWCGIALRTQDGPTDCVNQH